MIRIFAVKYTARDTAMERDKNGPVVVITNTRHAHAGETAVIQMTTPHRYRIRLTKKTPKRERFSYYRGRASSTTSPYKVMYVAKTSVRRVRGKTALTKLNTWQDETGRLLDDNFKATRKTIEARYGPDET